MPLSKLIFKPGVNREGTNLSNEGGWYECDKVRFRSGYPEKIGGWVQLSANTFLGTCRALWNWVTLAGANFIGVGTNLKYYVEQAGGYNDITPLRDFTLTGTYSQVASTTITITIVNHLVQTGDTVYLNFTTGDGVSDGYVATVTGANTFDVTAAVSATSSGNVSMNRTSTKLTNPFATTSGLTTVVVTHASHGALNNDFVTFSNVGSSVGGVPASDFNKEFQIVYLTSNTYSITVATAASSTTTGGGTLTAQYQINVGLDTFVQGVGWGSGPWNSSATSWGQSAALGAGGQLRLWTHDNFGQDLIFAPRNGAIYYWPATSYTFARGQLLADLATAAGYQGLFVPTQTQEISVAQVERFAVALGANPYDPTNPATTFDPMLVRWSDQEVVYDWVPSATNQSGEQRLASGSFIMGSLHTRNELLIWSDTALYSMLYQGPPYVFGFTALGDNTSIVSPNAMATSSNIVFWMGTDKFYKYTGRVETLYCSLRQYVFGDINLAQRYKFFSGTNEGFNEIWWFYCSADSDEIDRYVIYNHLEDIWYYGTLSRTAWMDSPLQDYPTAATGHVLLYHENGVDDGSTGTNVAIDSYIQSSDFDIGDGNNFSFVKRIIPDINFNGSTATNPQILLTVKPRKNPGDAYGTAPTPTVTRTSTVPVEQYTDQVYTRLRGRQLSFRIESVDLGTNWQLGVPRIDIRPDGRKT